MIRIRIPHMKAIVEIEHLKVTKITSETVDVERLVREFVEDAIILGSPEMHHDRDILLVEQLEKMGAELMAHKPPSIPPGEIN
jgi:hypothetical protein